MNKPGHFSMPNTAAKLVALLGSVFTLIFASMSFAGDIDFKAETKLNYRDSDSNRFPVNFPFPPAALPVGETTAFEETVDAGSHFEISNIALFWNWQWTDNVELIAKVDVFDLYEKNPTSTDLDVSLDRLILRYGTRHTQGELPQNTDFYAQFGKFNKFERQEDMHLESYGLASTAFNRVEDSGFEFGIDAPNGFYAKLSYTTGNPVFMRDPNALAGDNGIDQSPPPNFDPEYKTGIVVLYDAEVEGLDLSEAPEIGAALGYRWVSDTGSQRINLMAFHYEREMADTVELHGTFYGADLDVLDLSEVVPDLRLPISHEDKTETGLNLWWYGENSSVFAQYVSQDIAGLERDGWELEWAYAFGAGDALGESLNLNSIVPVVRYSELTNDFVGPSVYPSPSLWWDWTKLDVGFALNFDGNISLTTEYAFTEFVRGGVDEDNNELLLTFEWRYD